MGIEQISELEIDYQINRTIVFGNFFFFFNSVEFSLFLQICVVVMFAFDYCIIMAPTINSLS